MPTTRAVGHAGAVCLKLMYGRWSDSHTLHKVNFIIQLELIMRTYAKMQNGLPTVSQPSVNGWIISWNPDDERWYINHPKTHETIANFKERRNAIQFAKTRNVD